MATLSNKVNVVADPIVITIDDDDEGNEIIIDSISRVNGENVNDLAKCEAVQEEEDIISIIDKSSETTLPTPTKKKFSRKRCASNQSGKESKRLKFSNDVPTENRDKNQASKTLYIFLDGICDYYMEKNPAKSKCLKKKLKQLKKRGDIMVTALELVKSLNQTLEQQMREWNLEVVETNNVFEKFIINCQSVCETDRTLDMEMKEGLVISLSYDYPTAKLKDASNIVMANMQNIVSVSKYDSVISEGNLTYLRAVAVSALQNASALKINQWQVKEMTDEIRDGFFQDNKPVFPSPCFSTKAVGRQKILAKANLASSQVNGALPINLSKNSLSNGTRTVSSAAGSSTNNLSKNNLSNGTRTVSSAAGSSTSPVQNDIEITDKTLRSTASKMLNNTSCLAEVNPVFGSEKELDFIPISAVNKENRCGRNRETRSVSLIPTLGNSVINKTIVVNVQNEQQNLNFLGRNLNSGLVGGISDVNSNLVARNHQLNCSRENQNMFLVSQFERASDLTPVFSNSNPNGRPQFFTTMNPQSQLIVQVSDSGNVNSVCTLANSNQNFPRHNDLITSANFSASNSNNQIYGQFMNSLQNSNRSSALNIPLPPIKLRPIAIDGSNVAFSHGVVNHKFSCKGIELCIKHFLQLGHTTVKAFVPHFRTRLSKEIVDGEILHQLGRKQQVVFTPSRVIDGRMVVCYDDRFILDFAVESGAVVVSNDNFRDLLHESPQYNFIIKNRLLMYTFVEDLFLIPKDPLGRRGPDLKTFLRF